MAEPEETDQPRERKLDELLALGSPALPNRYGPTRLSDEVREGFEALEGSRVRVAGRLMTARHMGKASFAHIQDTAGRIELYFKLDVLGDIKYTYFKLLDLADIIGAEGTVFKTGTGEVTIQVDDLLLANWYAPRTSSTVYRTWRCGIEGVIWI